MDIVVRGGTEKENQSLKKLAEETFKGSGLSKKQSMMIIVVDIDTPAFYVAVRFKKDVEPITLDDVAKIHTQSGRTKLQVVQERYYEQVMEKLWSVYGKKNVEQDERNMLYLNKRDDDMGKIVIYDLTEELRERTIDVIWNILPEGFKVRHFKHFDDGFILVSTDAPKTNRFSDTIRELSKEIGGP